MKRKLFQTLFIAAMIITLAMVFLTEIQIMIIYGAIIFIILCIAYFLFLEDYFKGT
jgi:hypothetical protein